MPASHRHHGTTQSSIQISGLRDSIKTHGPGSIVTMGRDLETKRPRLDLDAHPLTSTRPSPLHSLAHPPHPPPQAPGTLAAVPAPVSASGSSIAYQPHPDSYPPQQASISRGAPISVAIPHQGPLSATLPPPSGPLLPSPGHSASAPPASGYLPPGEARPGYGPLGTSHSRGIQSGPPHSRPSSSGTERQQTAPAGAPPVMEHHPGMEQPQAPLSAYGPPLEAPVNGSSTPLRGPNGVPPPGYHPVQSAQQQFVQPPPPGYQQHASYPPPGMYHPNDPNWRPPRGNPAKKHTRAHVACNNCRHRKQKCDENFPACSYCQQENITCEYRNVAPPKLDKNFLVVQDEIKALQDEVKALKESFPDMMRSALVEILNLQSVDRRAVSASPVRHALETRLASVSVDDGQVKEQAPGVHITGAQHLIQIPRIRVWFDQAEVKDEKYPYDLEIARGVPRLYGFGWSGQDQVFQDTYEQAEHDKVYNDGFSKLLRLDAFNKGGANPNGSLRLDESTVKRLHDSYMRNVWVTYPIFHAAKLKSQVATFIHRYGPPDSKPYTPPQPPQSAMSPTYGGMKRSHSQMEDSDPGESADPKRAIEHSLNNALVLLVLALGKLSEHEDFLMREDIKDVAGGPEPPSNSDNMSQASSPRFRTSTGTPRSASSHASPRFPATIMNPPPDTPTPNVSKYPGLAYYAKAITILSEFWGRRDLMTIQAYILAGLYWGQIGHMLLSADYIHKAANDVIEMLHRFNPLDITIEVPQDHSNDIEDVKPSHPKPREERWAGRSEHERNEADLFLIAFWSVQQLEGDILAELEKLPSSQLPNYVEIDGRRVATPTGVVGSTSHGNHEMFISHLDTNDIMFHFAAQIYLRTLLNRAHLALYGTKEEKQQLQGLTWADMRPADAWESVKQWRDSLPAHFKWSDSDDQSTDILTARLRAKYYGAAYMINRKILTEAIRDPNIYDLSSAQYMSAEDLYNAGSDVSVSCKRCILSAMSSTIAFDRAFPQRPRLPNVYGTVTAQFGNMLVLGVSYLNDKLRPLVPVEEFAQMLDRTINLLNNLTPISDVFRTMRNILQACKAEIRRLDTGRVFKTESTGQFRLPANIPTPPSLPQYGSPLSGRAMSGDAGTPTSRQYHESASATSSFSAHHR
ncbi:hypothetical protein BT63DRAFT_209728 [Microthyrium microscopicum]|uniref:Zn(2)-C6 fungal-type domain-containing protein n=1 Tax=Microthyrium microscopicum TaxID=703497 RepID=A0A6A6UHK5_9PEZI|nr:hypothetical protein BT63DRAFT_209728 [Microthyrium microscopicum]